MTKRTHTPKKNKGLGTGHGQLVFIAAFFLILSSCASLHKGYSPYKKISPDKLREDFDIAWNSYRKNHPGYDWYSPADSVNLVFEKVRASISDSLNEPEFRLRLSYALAAIRCGHTSVIPSKDYLHYIRKNREPVFPLSIRALGPDSLIVVRNFHGDSLSIRQGTVIKNIDGISPDKFISQMKQYVSADGFNDTFRELQISSGFPARFKWMYGLKKQYRIGYIDSMGKIATDTLAWYVPPNPDSLNRLSHDKKTKPQKPSEPKPTYGKFKVDTTLNLGILELNNFSYRKVPGLIRNSFKTIENSGIKNLVIDLRTNGGGKIDNSILLARYVIDHPFRAADSVSAINLEPAYPQYLEAAWVFRYFRWLFAKKQADGRWHMGAMERKIMKPKKKNHFNGDLYVLTGGATFSASTLFLSKIYRQPNVTLVGEETGGGARGNSAVFTPMITLPNTHIQLRLPLFRLISDVTMAENGRGFFPGLEVKPDSHSIKNGTDKKMQAVKTLVSQKANNP